MKQQGQQDIFQQLMNLGNIKSMDGSRYNRLMKENKNFTEDDLEILRDSYRDMEKIPNLPNEPQGFEIMRDQNGFIVPNDIDEILTRAYINGASDIHISVGAPPKIRLHGELVQMPYMFLTKPVTERLLSKIVSEEQREIFEADGDLDFAYAISGLCRFRVNMLKHKGTWAAVFRALSNSIPDANVLNIPMSVQELTKKKRGIILVTGPTGSGKSTTLASLIKIINQTRRENIITLEDPIEYVHKNMKSTIIQREIGFDSKSFASGIRAALREDPDVILIGEMRDPETIAAAITAAETGHLVFSTLHTIGAAATVDRIIDSFSADQQPQIRAQFSTVIEGVISQQLVPMANGRGRVAAFEIMLPNSAIRAQIREGKIAQMNSTIQTNKAMGMITLDDSLRNLMQKGLITEEKCIEFSTDQDRMRDYLGGGF